MHYKRRLTINSDRHDHNVPLPLHRSVTNKNKVDVNVLPAYIMSNAILIHPVPEMKSKRVQRKIDTSYAYSYASSRGTCCYVLLSLELLQSKEQSNAQGESDWSERDGADSAFLLRCVSNLIGSNTFLFLAG